MVKKKNSSKKIKRKKITRKKGGTKYNKPVKNTKKKNMKTINIKMSKEEQKVMGPPAPQTPSRLRREGEREKERAIELEALTKIADNPKTIFNFLRNG